MSKPFSCKAWEHIASYSWVKYTLDFFLSFKLVQVFATYLVAVLSSTSNLLFTQIPASQTFVERLDAAVETKILTVVDHLVAIVEPYYAQAAGFATSSYKKIDNVVAENKRHSQMALSSAKKNAKEAVTGYLKPVNEYASSSVDKVLPKSKKRAFETKAAASDEISKSIDIVSDTIERSKDLILAKSTELSNSVVSTYNKEFEAAPKNNYYVKVASASVNTGVTLLKNVKTEIIQPLKFTTQTYVSETESTTQKNSENAAAKAKEFVKGSAPVVSALA